MAPRPAPRRGDGVGVSLGPPLVLPRLILDNALAGGIVFYVQRARSIAGQRVVNSLTEGETAARHQWRCRGRGVCQRQGKEDAPGMIRPMIYLFWWLAVKK